MTIEFDEKKHEYTVDGTRTPSVTQLISLLHPETYAGVPKKTLERAAKYGEKVHELVENIALKDVYPNLDKSYEKLAVDRFVTLQNRYKIKATACEQIVAYVEDGLPLYAGKYDMLAEVNGEIAIVDIKATAQYHANLLVEQLPMYQWAIEQMNPDIKITKGYCLWLPKKNLGNLIEVKLPTKEQLLPKLRKAYEAFWSH